MKISAADHEMFAHLLGLFAEAGVTVDQFAGGNEFYVPDDVVIDDPELHEEIVQAVRPGTPVPLLAPSPPGGGDGPALSEPAPQAAPQASADDEPARQAALPPLPPKAGPGSSRAAWVVAAQDRNLVVTDDMTRDDIIKRVEAHDDR